MNPRKLEYGIGMLSAGIPDACKGHEDTDAPTFWLLA